MKLTPEILTNPGAILLMAAISAILLRWWHVSRTGRWSGSLFSHRKVPLTLLAILACGFFVVQWAGEREAARQRLVLIDNASRAALAVDRSHLEQLSATESDLGSTHYRRLKEQFQLIRSTMPGTRFLYLMRKVKGRFVFQVDSEKPGSPDESPPGQVYTEVTQALQQAFERGEEVTIGPETDRWGTFITALVPIGQQRTGMVTTMLGADMDAGEYMAAVKGNQLAFALFVCLLSLAVYLGFACMINFRARLDTMSADHSAPLIVRWGTAASVGLVGAIVTVTLFILARHDTLDGFSMQFSRQAFSMTEAFYRTLHHSLEDIDDLRRFYKNAMGIDRQSAASYSDPVTEEYSVTHAFEWAPRVLLGKRKIYEESAARDGLKHFVFKELNRADKLVVAGERSEYFPVYYVSPLKGNEAALGFDLFSDPVRRAAMEGARDEGKAAATAPLRLVQEKGDQYGYLVFSPVFDGRGTPSDVSERRRKLRGFAVGVYRAADVARNSIINQPETGLLFQIEDMSAPREKRLLYRHETRAGAGDWSVGGSSPRYERFMDFAGRDWRVTVIPGSNFIATNISYWYWAILPLGALVSGVVALFLNGSVTRRFRLEVLVRSRTKELEELNNRLKESMAHAAELADQANHANIAKSRFLAALP